MGSELLIRGGTILTIDDGWTVPAGDVLVRDGRLVQVGGSAVPQARDYEILDAEGCVVMPGLVATHVHTCQTLARGRADDLALLDWLKRIVWPYEAALGADDVAASARLSFAELLLGGTTCLQDMGTVRHTERIFEAADAAGIRAVIGKAMMDAGDGVPAGLLEATKASLVESEALVKAWQGQGAGRLGYAYAPRFVLSCSEELLRAVVADARRLGARMHTHASENRDELAVVKRERGQDNIAYLDGLGMSGADVGLAHCVWPTDAEIGLLARTGTHVLHCPSSNLKLASGIAPIPELLAAGVSVSLGPDGAPCNNNLDGFLEMRLAGILHKPRVGPQALPARDVVRLATRAGARALGLEADVGSLEVGKRADVIVVDVSAPHVAPVESPYGAIAYAARSTDVRHVVIDGKVVVRDRAVLTIDVPRAVADAKTRARAVFGRMR